MRKLCPLVILLVLVASPRLLGIESRRIEERASEPGGAVLEVRGGRLVRVGPGGTVPLESMEPGGTGTVRALAPDPFGGTFVAADRGIFLASPDSKVLGSLNLGNEVPPGRPAGLHLDRRRRLWIATDRAFGVADPSLRQSVTFAAREGVPAGPFLGLAPAPGGGLVLQTPRGAFLYRPDSGPPPRVRVVSANGKPYRPGRRIAITYPEKLSLVLAGQGAGGLRFRALPDLGGRYRAGAAEGSRLTFHRIDIGRREVRVVGMDRDLNTSPPVTVPVEVRWPFYYNPAFVVPTGLAVSALVLAGALLAARRRGGGREVYARAALSALLALVVGLQLLAGLVPHARGWPFVGYSMYTSCHQRGEVVGVLVLEGIGADGKAHRLAVRRAAAALLHGGPEAARSALAAHGRSLALVAVRVTEERFQLTAAGPVKLPAEVRLYYAGPRNGGPISR